MLCDSADCGKVIWAQVLTLSIAGLPSDLLRQVAEVRMDVRSSTSVLPRYLLYSSGCKMEVWIEWGQRSGK